MNTDSRIVFILSALLASATAGCGESQDNASRTSNHDASDAGAPDDNTDTGDGLASDTSPDAAGNPGDAGDAGGAGDAGDADTAETDPDAHTNVDASTDDASAADTAHDAAPDADACDPAELAAATIGPVDAVSTGAVTVVEDAGVFTWTIDASAGGPALAASSPWVYVDLAAAAAAPVTDTEAFGSAAWTLAFKRSVIRLNSGDSGPGTWLLSRVEGAAFDAVTTAPGRDAMWLTDDFVTDTCEVLTEGRGTPVSAFGIWYNYDPGTHAVTPLPDTTWVLYDRMTHAAYKLGIEEWTGGVFTLRVSAL